MGINHLLAALCSDENLLMHNELLVVNSILEVKSPIETKLNFQGTIQKKKKGK